jgi:hypothetical protein
MAVYLPGAAAMGEDVLDACARELLLYAPWHGAIAERIPALGLVSEAFDVPLSACLLTAKKLAAGPNYFAETA